MVFDIPIIFWNANVFKYLHFALNMHASVCIIMWVNGIRDVAILYLEWKSKEVECVQCNGHGHKPHDSSITSILCINYVVIISE